MPERTCTSDGCEKPTPSSRHKYCTKQCQYRQWKRNMKADPERWQANLDRQNERRANSYQSECGQCGSSFSATKDAIYCSPECQGEAKRWRYLKNDRCDVEYAECRSCAEMFVVRPWFRSHCSDRCRDLDGSLPLVMGWCPVCQAPHGPSPRPRSSHIRKPLLSITLFQRSRAGRPPPPTSRLLTSCATARKRTTSGETASSCG